MKIEDCILLKKIGLIQPPPTSDFSGAYHVLNKLKPEVWTSAVLAESVETAPFGLGTITSKHDLEFVTYEPTLEEFWSFLVNKLPLTMTEPSLMLIYNWEKKTYELMSRSFDTVVSAPNQKDALFMFFTLSLFHGKEGNG